MSSEKISFEQALKELQDIVHKLETGELNLDEAVKMYERGVELKVYCEQLLKDTKSRIQELEAKTKTQQAE